ncbi:MAG: hypothetical protein R3D25_04045 [Geminicoccaceae bacterium]
MSRRDRRGNNDAPRSALSGDQGYALAIGGQAIVYSAGTYPYFFNDSNANGKVDPGEAVFPSMPSSPGRRGF